MNYGAPRQNTSPLAVGLLAACGGCAAIFILGIVLLVQIVNRSPFATTLRADSLMRHKRYLEAEKALLGVVAKQPEDAMALNQLAWCYYKDNKPAEGEAYAKRAVAIEPNPSYIDTLAHIDLGLKRYSEAEKLFKQGLQGKPMGESHDGLGQIYEHQGHMDKALAEYQQAYDLDPAIEGLDARLNHAEQTQHRSKKRR